jgi:hypothetical protein
MNRLLAIFGFKENCRSGFGQCLKPIAAEYVSSAQM